MFVGDGFLKQMVRNIVGTLLQLAAEGYDGNDTICSILEMKDRSAAGPTAEPWGLHLEWVEYPDGRL